MLTATIGSAGVVRLRDGRAVTYIATGPEDGFPSIYCHGAIGSPRWQTPGLDEVIERLGIRYLVVNRPGFAGSDPSPGRAVVGHAHDLGELMSILGHGRFSVVGVSAGAPYALACAWALTDRLVGLAAVSPLGPADGPGASPSFRYRIRSCRSAHRVPAPRSPWSLRALGLQRQTRAGDDRRLPGVPEPWGFDLADIASR